MKKFAYFISGVLVASFTQALIPQAQASFTGMEEGRAKNRSQYQEYLKCRDKNPKVVSYECLRLYPAFGFHQL